jgi:peroxiredoxin Q/BCP
MRTVVRTLAAVSLAALFAPAPTPAAGTVAPGDPAPAFSLPGTDGETHSLEAFRGRSAVILVFYRGVW